MIAPISADPANSDAVFAKDSPLVLLARLIETMREEHLAELTVANIGKC